MAVSVLSTPPLDAAGGKAGPERAPELVAGGMDTARLRRIVTEDYGFLWRSLRRLGVPESDADDGAQRVLGVLARRMHDIAPGAERAFLFQTALRVASEMRRSQRRSRLTLADEEIEEPVDDAPGPDVVLEQREARRLLGLALDAIDIELAAVFILFELEELTTAEIARLLEIPAGTVSTRLRRARQDFKKAVLQLRGRQRVGRRSA